MISYEFDIKSKEYIRLGEIVTPIFFKKIDNYFAPTILCLKLDFHILTEHKIEMLIKAVTGFIYWDIVNECVKREEISFSEQKRLELPLVITVPFQQFSEQEEDKDAYYITLEKVRCALQAKCLTSSMKEEYFIKVHGGEIPKELQKIYQYFFADTYKEFFT